MSTEKNIKVLEIIYGAVDELNELLDSDQRLDQQPGETLLGHQSKIDSLALVQLLALIEEGVEDELGLAITIADERAMSQEHSPFRSLDSLHEFVSHLVEDSSSSGEAGSGGLSD